jgi:hypothetical protein
LRQGFREPSRVPASRPCGFNPRAIKDLLAGGSRSRVPPPLGVGAMLTLLRLPSKPVSEGHSFPGPPETGGAMLTLLRVPFFCCWLRGKASRARKTVAYRFWLPLMAPKKICKQLRPSCAFYLL